MIRFQEVYECPVWKNKIFTIEQYSNWYAEKNGSFTYYNDFDGFNVPRESIIKVIKSFPNLSNNEKAVEEILIKNKVLDDDYVVATYGDNNGGALKHEIAHGLFRTNTAYKRAIKASLSDIPEKLIEQMNSYLLKGGYSESVLEDEMQAYFVVGYNDTDIYGCKKNCEFIKKIKPYAEKVKKIFESYYI